MRNRLNSTVILLSITLLSLPGTAQIITSIAGNGQPGFSGDGGPATAASFNTPLGIAVDAAGNLYLADTNNSRIRKISASGTITTIAGTGAATDTGDGGPATAATFRPLSVAVDGAGNVYLISANRVRRIRPDGIIVAFAGTGGFGSSGDGGPATSATLSTPIGLAADAAGNVYIADQGAYVVRRVSLDGIITTVAGNGLPGFSGDGGPATSASLRGPVAVAVDGSGNLFISDQGNHRIRKVSGGIITTVAGNGTAGFSGDGGPATSASLNSQYGVAVDSLGNLFIADGGGSRVRRVSTSGVITTYVGGGSEFPGDGSPATSVFLAGAINLCADSSNNLYLIDFALSKIRKITPGGGGGGTSFSVTPQVLAFSVETGSTQVAPQQLAVSSNTTGLAFTASATTSIGGAWLSVSPVSGTTPGNLVVSVNAANLAAGFYLGNVTVTVPNATPSTVSTLIGLIVTSQLSVTPGVVFFEAAAGFGNPPSQTLRIANQGTSTLSYTASTTTPWLSVSPATGNITSGATGTVQLTANVAGLAPGTHTGTITITSPSINQSTNVQVTLIITQPAQTILVSRSGLLYTGVAGGGVLPAQSFGVLNAGRNVLSWTASASTLGGGNWLSVSPASGSSDAASTAVPQVDVRVDSTGLAAGSYTGTVQVASSGAVNSPQTVTVFLTILPAGGNPGVQVDPTGLIFVSSGAQTVTLAKAGPGSLSVSAAASTASGGNWLTVTPSSGSLSPGAPQTLNVQATAGSLASGIYQGTITLTFGDASTKVVNVLLVVPSATEASAKRPGVVAACTPSQLVTVVRSIGSNFNSPANWPTNIEALVVDNCGTARADATVIATFSNGDPPLVLVSLKNGTYSGTWRPLTQSASVTIRVRATAALLTAVEATVQGQVAANANAPVLYPGGIVHAASFANGAPLAPGSIVSLFGSKMAAADAATRVPLPTTLGNTTLRVGDTLVPLYVSTDGQINAQIPYELTAPANYQMVLRAGNVLTVPESFNLSLTRPGIFTTNQQGTGQGVVLNTSQRVVDSASPAAAGDVLVIYTTGLGATNPAVASGVAAPSAEPLARVTNTVTATVGGQAATVQFAGLTPGFVGLYQVNVQIPAGIAPGSAVPVVLTQRGVPSNTVTIALR